MSNVLHSLSNEPNTASNVNVYAVFAGKVCKNPLISHSPADP